RRHIRYTATPTPENYTLSLHDALPISHTIARGLPPVVGRRAGTHAAQPRRACGGAVPARCPRKLRSDGRAGSPVRRTGLRAHQRDRKSTRLNSSHVKISYAVFCLKKKR